MRRFIFALTILLFHAGLAQAGWMDALKSQVEGAVNQTLGGDRSGSTQASQTPAENSSDQVQTTATTKPQSAAKNTDADKLELYGGHSSSWNVAPEGAPRVLDMEIKGMRLGMPEALIEDVLTQNGFKKVRYDTYTRVEEEMGKVQRSSSITFRTVEPSEAFLSNLDGPLKALVAKARKRMEAARTEARPTAVGRGRDDPRMRVSQSQGGGGLKLVYRFDYRQYFGNDISFDRDLLMKQFRGRFGEPTYQPKNVHMRQGSAFGTNASWLIYHDAALVPAEERDDLLRKIADKGDRRAMKDGFSHPCGASPTRVMNCVNNPLARLYKDDLDSRLEAARILYAPVMMVQFSRPNIKAALEWQYLLGEKGIRERFAKQNASKTLPKATLDF